MRPDEEDERRASLVGKGAPRGDALRPFRNYCFQFRRIIRVYVQRTLRRAPVSEVARL